MLVILKNNSNFRLYGYRTVSLKIDKVRIFKDRQFNSKEECAEFVDKILKQVDV